MGATCCTQEQPIPKIGRRKYNQKSTDSDSGEDAHDGDVYAAILGLENSGKTEVVQKFHDMFNLERTPTDLKDEKEQEEHERLKQNDIIETQFEYDKTNFIFTQLPCSKTNTYNIGYINQNEFNCIILLINGVEWNMSMRIDLKVDKQDCFGNQVRESVDLNYQDYYIDLVRQLDENLPREIPFLIFVTNHNGNIPPESSDSNYAYLNLDKLERSCKIMAVDIKKDNALYPGLKYINQVMFDDVELPSRDDGGYPSEDENE